MNSTTTVRELSSSKAAVAARARRAAAKVVLSPAQEAVVEAILAPVAPVVRTAAKIYDMPVALETALEAPVRQPRKPREPKFEKPTAEDFRLAALAVAEAELAYALVGLRAHQLSLVASERVKKWEKKVAQLRAQG